MSTTLTRPFVDFKPNFDVAITVSLFRKCECGQEGVTDVDVEFTGNSVVNTYWVCVDCLAETYEPLDESEVYGD